MTRMRQTIAKRLKDSQNSMAMLTTFNEIDMSAAQKLRADYKDLFEKKHGSKLGFMSIFMKACASALQAFPDVNAYIDADTNEIVYRNFVDISIAVATPTGLVVPVIRGVEDLDFAGCEKAVAEYGAKARNGTIAMEDFVGGTFTISNGGVYGSLFGTPIINPPQSAILGMHSIVQRPVAVDGKVEIRPMMYVACTYDHRLLDGSTAVQFLKHIKQCVEDPRRLVLNM
jgi:2-oxoglutarate dehydrogenase E2 component (dihydrolipoamide succinyltransferase)